MTVPSATCEWVHEFDTWMAVDSLDNILGAIREIRPGRPEGSQPQEAPPAERHEKLNGVKRVRAATVATARSCGVPSLALVRWDAAK